MKTKPVAAVYDRRRKKEPTLIDRRNRAVCVRPTTMARSSVAAVCDRRIENEPGAHNAPLQVVAAVCDHRASPALTERRYKTANPRSLPGIVCLLLFLSSLVLSASQQKQNPPPVDPTVVYDTTVKVLRGGTCEVPLRAISPQGYNVKFEIFSGPRGGSLSGPQRNSKSSVSYFYTHDGNKNSSQDSFRIKAKSGPQKAWGYAKATILVEEPPARFAADVSALDFAAVFLGESRTLPVRIKNAGGGRLQGRLKLTAPWTLGGAADLTLSEGETKKILITFEPVSTDTQRGSLIFESGAKPFPEITLQGVGESRFEVPEKATFEQRVGADQLRIPIKNLTAAPLPISIPCPPPLEASDAITLPPESSGELLLTLPARSFAERSALVTLGDGATTRDIRIQLPPPPSRLEWEIVGKNQLGKVTLGGRPHTLTANLKNTGSATASVVLRAAGGGISLAPGQPANLAIASGGSVTVNATWKFPNTLGLAEVVLVAETTGLPPLQTESWQADVQLPPVAPTPSPSPMPNPSASPSPTPPTVLTKEEQEALRKRMPRDFSCRLEPELHWTAFFPTRRTAAAIVSWSYEGPEPVEFIIQREVHQREGFFEQRIQVPSDLPPQSSQPVWKTLKPADAKIQKLPDGRWQTRIPGLPPSYHKIRIIAKEPGSPRMDGADFSLLVGDIPLPEPLPWTLPGLLALCAAYLLRKKLRALFG